MIHVLICDDDARFAARLKTALDALFASRKTEARIGVFGAAEEIGGETLSLCDIAFLDVDFAGKEYNGLDIARRIRALRGDTVIVFVTNYVEYAPEGYELRAFRYLLKDEIERKLPDCLAQALVQLKTEKSDIKILSEGETVSLPLRDLLYVESMGHTLIYHMRFRGCTPDRQFSCYGTLGKAEEELAPRGFLRVQKSYLVNMAHIRRLSSTEALLSDGRTLPVSAKNYAACKRQYLLWRGRQ